MHTPAPEVARSDFAALVDRARQLAASPTRRILGITGAPGSGKSTLADEIVDALGADAVLVPMDGFHLAEAELKRLGIHDRKGALDTFDAGGFVALLRRMRENTETVVYAPTFRRDLEEAIAGAIWVPSNVPLVVTEGNYLLRPDGAWSAVRGLLDEVWYLEPDEHDRLDRLVRRHMDFGRDVDTANARARGSDQRNAEVIAATKEWADLIVVGS
ncbi:MAG TPA: nucleoside/nucleotide kinase family protein [Acidothermaceae bacterium]